MDFQIQEKNHQNILAYQTKIEYIVFKNVICISIEIKIEKCVYTSHCDDFFWMPNNIKAIKFQVDSILVLLIGQNLICKKGSTFDN